MTHSEARLKNLEKSCEMFRKMSYSSLQFTSRLFLFQYAPLGKVMMFCTVVEQAV